MKKQTSVGIAVIIIIILAIIYFSWQSSSNSATQSSTTNGNVSAVENKTNGQVSASADHMYSYLSSIINVLHSLYLTTQELTDAQTRYPTSSQDIQQTTAMLGIDSDLMGAVSSLQSYVNDKDDSIKSVTTLLYADVLTLKNANQKISEALRTATPDTLNPQQIKYDIAQYAAAQDTLQKDLFQNKILLVITKGLIQLPVEQGEATGPIKYSLSSSQRQDLISEIQRAFGSSLNDYNKNTYLLAAKVLQLSLTFQTYEEQKAYKLTQ